MHAIGIKNMEMVVEPVTVKHVYLVSINNMN